MPTSKRPRKHRTNRYRAIDYNPLFGMDQRMQNDLCLTPHLTLEKFRTGLADEGDWHTLAAVLNVSKVLADATQSD